MSDVSKESTVEMMKLDGDYISIHNHPSGKTFSLRDFDAFSRDNKLKIMMVLGNNGNIYFVGNCETR